MNMNIIKSGVCGLVAIGMALLLNEPASAGSKPVTTLVSVNSSGVKGNGNSNNPAISSDGRYVAFMSAADNLAGSTNGFWNVFIRDTLTGTTERVSVSYAGGAPDGNSGSISISADGRYVAFASDAANLAAGDTNGWEDVFVRDRAAGTTELISTNGNQTSFFPSISADGRYVAFASFANNLVADDTNNAYDIFIKDRQTGAIERVASSGVEPDGESRYPAITPDGRYVAFLSYAANLVPGDTNGYSDIFVYDRSTGIIGRASVSSSGEQGNSICNDVPAISSDGRYVAFRSRSSNLTGAATNGFDNIFVHDVLTGATEIASKNSRGVPGDNDSYHPTISSDGNYVAFESTASNLAKLVSGGNVYYRDRAAGSTNAVVDGNNSSGFPSISGNGLKIVFQSYSTNLTAGDTDTLSDIYLNAR